MKKNISSVEKTVRIIVGIIIIGVGYYSGLNYWIIGIGVIILITGGINSCPIYSLLGINTNHSKAEENSQSSNTSEVPVVPPVHQSEDISSEDEKNQENKEEKEKLSEELSQEDKSADQ